MTSNNSQCNVVLLVHQVFMLQLSLILFGLSYFLIRETNTNLENEPLAELRTSRVPLTTGVPTCTYH